jgi:hypothetical protein
MRCDVRNGSARLKTPHPFFFLFKTRGGFKFKQDSLKSFFLIPFCSRHGVRDAKAESLKRARRGETFLYFIFDYKV